MMSAVALQRGLELGQIMHWEQAPLDLAASLAVPKYSGGGFYINTPPDDETIDITPLEAISYALQGLPNSTPRAAMSPIVVN
jgi:hypothetical protein